MAGTSHKLAEEAEVIALKALEFLASEPERLVRFLDLTGSSIDVIRSSAASPAFLGGVLDHLLGDQTLLLLFAAHEGLPPEDLQRLRRHLPGAADAV